ncbi:cold-shock protein [Parasulfitobacter algicola]|uniref:Cold shock domain-containing protein n=1 Tax=Parasulfitobacter algicola TaxID=2614809 RepID=A0ABX2IZB0_9RHOB|nr:cold shock domain-containing protein [Sulfitobacter algicola]NSX55673.1 cold shock domain-containing protein [Sulfitobacter algicola]
MTNEDTDTHETVTGHVKWFDPTKGFGFVVSDDGGPDILLHANVLRNFGQSSVADSANITVTVQKTTRGIQAVEVIDIAPPEGNFASTLTDLMGIDTETIELSPLEPARVKWFDKGKGFGFANVFGRDEDVFIHIEILRSSGFADLQPGEAVCLRVMDGQRGRMATFVASWEASLKDDQ